MRRWRCRKCCRGQNAPARMKRTDVRRYCLTCSKRTGHLVERHCPSLERERRQAKAARARVAARRAAKRSDRSARDADRRAERETVAGVVVRQAAGHMWRALTTLGYVDDARPMPDIFIFHSERGTRGYAHAHGTVRLYFGTRTGRGPDAAEVNALLLHELCHHIDGAFVDEHHHDHRFNGALCDAARELWGFDEISSGEGYGPSSALEQWLRRHLKETKQP